MSRILENGLNDQPGSSPHDDVPQSAEDSASRLHQSDVPGKDAGSTVSSRKNAVGRDTSYGIKVDQDPASW